MRARRAAAGSVRPLNCGVMPRSLVSYLLGLLVAVAGCSSTTAPLRIPSAAAVSSIEARTLSAFDAAAGKYHDSVTIEDPHQITLIIEFLSTLNSDMAVPLTTFPTATHSLIVSDTSGANLVVYVALNWIGGRNNVQGGGENRLRNISDEQRAKILRLVGLKEYPL